jgi:transposase
MMDTITDVATGLIEGGAPDRGVGRRSWSADEKRRMVEASFAPGASVSVVARRYDVNANQLFAWRKLYRTGSLSPAAVGPALIPVHVFDESDSEPALTEPKASTPRRNASGSLEIELPGGSRIRIRGSVDMDALRHVIEILSGRPVSRSRGEGR